MSAAKDKPGLTARRLRQLVRYDQDTGIFTRRVVTCGKVKVGKICGSPNTRGYLQCRIDGRLYLITRLAFLYMTDQWPAGVVDHINGDKLDNRWSNLRDVTQSVNMQNQRGATRRNKTGYLGVSPSGDKFVATIVVSKTKHHLGCFDDPRQASAVYLHAKRAMHAGNTL